MISDKYIKGRSKETTSSYEEIKLDSSDYKIITSLAENSDIFKKLHNITEYRLALEVVNPKSEFTIEEFKGAMKYAEYLKGYFN